MAAPWEEYGSTEMAVETSPWEQYSAPSGSAPWEEYPASQTPSIKTAPIEVAEKPPTPLELRAAERPARLMATPRGAFRASTLREEIMPEQPRLRGLIEKDILERVGGIVPGAAEALSAGAIRMGGTAVGGIYGLTRAARAVGTGKTISGAKPEGFLPEFRRGVEQVSEQVERLPIEPETEFGKKALKVIEMLPESAKATGERAFERAEEGPITRPYAPAIGAGVEAVQNLAYLLAGAGGRRAQLPKEVSRGETVLEVPRPERPATTELLPEVPRDVYEAPQAQVPRVERPNPAQADRPISGEYRPASGEIEAPPMPRMRAEPSPEAPPGLPEAAQGRMAMPELPPRGAPEVAAADIPAPPRPTGGTLYSGIPVEEISVAVRHAERGLKDALGVPEKGVEIRMPEAGRQPGAITAFRSPSEIAKSYPEIAPIVKRGREAMVEQERLREVFSQRLGNVDRLLGGTGVGSVPGFRGEFLANKKALNEVLLEGDMLGKRFSREELAARGLQENTITAYEQIRSAYDHALGIANRTRALRDKAPVSRREGYVPHFFHDFFIIADNEIIASARSLREAVSMGNDAARAGAQVKIVPKQFEFPGEAQQAAIIGDRAYFQMKQKLERDFAMSPDEAQAMLSELARLRGRSRFVGNFLERKGVSGWDKNLDWAHRHYFNMISRYAAMDKFKSNATSYFERRFGPIDKDYKGNRLAQYAKNYINDVNGVPTAVEGLLNDTLKATPVLNRFLGENLEARPALRLASATTNAVAIAKLGLYNVSAALVNGSQLLMVNTLLGPRWTRDGLKRVSAITSEQLRRGVGLEPRTTSDIGLLKQMDVPVAMGLESGAGYSAAHQMGKIFRTSTAMFQRMEFELRGAGALGGYYKALSEGKTRAQAIEAGREVNRRANFDYSISDAPDFIRRGGPVSQVLFQFKKFPVKTMEFMKNLEGMQNVRFWVPFALISGYYAFPGMEAFKNMVKAMTGHDIELATKDYLMRWAGSDAQKKAVAKTLFYGAFANEKLGGVDISRRIGGGDFIPSQIKDVFGPAISSTIRATQLAANGHWVEALRALTSAPGNIALALQNDGEITSPWDRERLRVRLDTRGRILKAVGFGTTGEAVERDVSRVIRYKEGQRRREEQEALDAYIKSEKRGDEAEIEASIKRMEELQMRRTGKRAVTEQKKKAMLPSERAVERLSRRERAQAQPLMEFREGEIPPPPE